MAYELRLAGRPPEQFATSEEAEARARELVRQDADLQVEIIDMATGRPYAPGASAGERDGLSKKVGY